MAKLLTSKRLLYKPLSLDHCSYEYVSWLNNKRVYKYLEAGGDYTFEKLRSYLIDVDKSNQILFWAIHLKSNDKHIGNIKIDPVNKKNGLGEYGILLGDHNEWGKGYAYEASNAVINHCFDELNLRKITLGVVENNVAAYNLYKKLGFETEGVYVRHALYDNRYMNVIRMALFNRKYEY